MGRAPAGADDHGLGDPALQQGQHARPVLAELRRRGEVLAARRTPCRGSFAPTASRTAFAVCTAGAVLALPTRRLVIRQLNSVVSVIAVVLRCRGHCGAALTSRGAPRRRVRRLEVGDHLPHVDAPRVRVAVRQSPLDVQVADQQHGEPLGAHGLHAAAQRAQVLDLERQPLVAHPRVGNIAVEDGEVPVVGQDAAPLRVQRRVLQRVALGARRPAGAGERGHAVEAFAGGLGAGVLGAGRRPERLVAVRGERQVTPARGAGRARHPPLLDDGLLHLDLLQAEDVDAVPGEEGVQRAVALGDQAERRGPGGDVPADDVHRGAVGSDGGTRRLGYGGILGSRLAASRCTFRVSSFSFSIIILLSKVINLVVLTDF